MIDKKRIADICKSLRLNKIDRYIIKKFIGTFLFSLLLIIAIVIVFDFNERIDKFTSSHAPWTMIVIYYLNYIPYIVNLLSSLFVFISVIFFTTKLADNSEISAQFAESLTLAFSTNPVTSKISMISGRTLRIIIFP